MIKKFKEIKNLAVFENFKWDDSVKDSQNTVMEFKDINVIYGRNYSGKTTLSRIVRAIERGTISDKFDNPSFTVLFSDNTEIKQDNLVGHGKKIRVYNDDFVRENLKFILNPNESVEPFAILGADNLAIQEQITTLESEIGSRIEGEESGLFLQLKNERTKLEIASIDWNSKREALNNQLNTKATNRDIGIKYNAVKFGDQNYNISKLQSDIQTVLEPTFTPITLTEQKEFERLIQEKVNEPIPKIQKVSLNISNLNISSQSLITREVGDSDKIQELVKNAVLNRWVKEGKELHQGNRKKCAFCDNEIHEVRWNELNKHFDEKSEKLELSLLQNIREVENKTLLVKNLFKPDIDLFYFKFHKDVKRIIELLQFVSTKFIIELETLKNQLEERKDNILNSKKFVEAVDYSKRINWILDIYDNIRQECNNFSSSLASEQAKARESLRLKEVFDFISSINYTSQLSYITNLKNEVDGVNSKVNKILNDITEKNELIESKRRALRDETRGADKVNEYLNNFFGHHFISLKAIETEEETSTNRYRFEVFRDRNKAYHLSEGESSLIAFCYFMAKLDDIETRGVKPIIWIDDPISSLDGNHIFFVYSLLCSEILNKNNFNQIFISTHNLDFLKYIKRLTGFYSDQNGRNKEYTKSYFIVNRQDRIASISLMPKYLKDFVTEFNYLFHQIYKCAKIDTIDDTNYTIFYNFGNNARKFLEVYLYYKFPDGTRDIEKLQKFFGNEIIPSLFTDRINNEYSHLSATFERGAAPIEVPEMKSAAESIIRRIKEIDLDQYTALVSSTGETP